MSEKKPTAPENTEAKPGCAPATGSADDSYNPPGSIERIRKGAAQNARLLGKSIDEICEQPPGTFRAAKFVIQRPEYPDWFAGWNEHNYASWTSSYDDARLVRIDDLVDTLTRLAHHKPIAALHSPNVEVSEPEAKP